MICDSAAVDSCATWVRYEWTDNALPDGAGTFLEHEGQLFAAGDSIWIGSPINP